MAGVALILNKVLQETNLFHAEFAYIKFNRCLILVIFANLFSFFWMVGFKICVLFGAHDKSKKCKFFLVKLFNWKH